MYAPHDLSGIEMAKWKKIRRKGKSRWDVMDQLGMDPRKHYKVDFPPEYGQGEQGLTPNTEL